MAMCAASPDTYPYPCPFGRSFRYESQWTPRRSHCCHVAAAEARQASLHSTWRRYFVGSALKFKLPNPTPHAPAGWGANRASVPMTARPPIRATVRWIAFCMSFLLLCGASGWTPGGCGNDNVTRREGGVKEIHEDAGKTPHRARSGGHGALADPSPGRAMRNVPAELGASDQGRMNRPVARCSRQRQERRS